MWYLLGGDGEILKRFGPVNLSLLISPAAYVVGTCTIHVDPRYGGLASR